MSDFGERTSAENAEGAHEISTFAGMPIVTDASVPVGTWQLRDGFGSVLWEFNEARGTGRSTCATRRGMPSALPEGFDPR